MRLKVTNEIDTLHGVKRIGPRMTVAPCVFAPGSSSPNALQPSGTA